MTDLTRGEALDQVRKVMAAIELEADDRDWLFRAVVDYGHACASEVLAECKRAIEGAHGVPGIV